MADRERSIEVRRREGVEKAWARERELVAEGRGTREWTVSEQKQLLKKGSVDGYEGHHMKSVSKHPEHADNPKNIQFLKRSEHLKAHKGNFRNESNGRYNERTQKIRDMKDGKVRAMNSRELSDKAVEKRGYTKYARNNDRAHVKKTARKGETARETRPAQKHSARAQGRYGKGESARAGARQSGAKSAYGSRSPGARQSGARTGGYGKGGQSGGKGGQSSGGHGGQSSGGHGGHGGHGGQGR